MSEHRFKFSYGTDIDVRALSRDGEPWFVAKDVCDVLGIGNSRQALSYLDEDERGVTTHDTLGGRQQVAIINESGLYSLILRSRKPEAKRFKKWITAEVLPTIRKTGGAYIQPGSKAELDLTDPDTALDALSTAIDIAKAERQRRLEAEGRVEELETQVEQDAPLVWAARAFFDSEGLLTVPKAAKALQVQQRPFYEMLRSWGWIEKVGSAPRAYALNRGFMRSRVYPTPNGLPDSITGKLTKKGLERANAKIAADPDLFRLYAAVA